MCPPEHAWLPSTKCSIKSSKLAQPPPPPAAGALRERSSVCELKRRDLPSAAHKHCANNWPSLFADEHADNGSFLLDVDGRLPAHAIAELDIAIIRGDVALKSRERNDLCSSANKRTLLRSYLGFNSTSSQAPADSVIACKLSPLE